MKIIAILLLIVIIFGISSSMQSYATAQQAQIEVARVAQGSNTITLLVLVLLIILVLAILAGIVLLYFSRRRQPQQRGQSPIRVVNKDASELPAMDPSQALGTLVQMRMLEMLDSMKSSRQLPAPGEEQPADEPLSWLR